MDLPYCPRRLAAAAFGTNRRQLAGCAIVVGKPARCRLFACADDLSVLENFIFGDAHTSEPC